ncbi:undecaprenyldiphospho-muramoylpentapeptide beta-N-acetylglucosaminyltransferase [Chitinibacteraceae bacterium HSL-7]
MNTKTLMVMAGGTGGHIFPALAVANACRANGWNVVWLGAEGAMETRIVPQHGIPLETLAITGVRGNGIVRKLKQPLVQARALMAARRVIKQYRVDAAIGFGGFTGFAGGLAARSAGLPLVVHEQNSVAGLTNSILAKVADRVLYAFPSAFDAKDGLVGNPVRDEIGAVPPPEARFADRAGPLRVLVVGGSLGAKVFNDTLPQALAQLALDERPLVTHQAGEKHIDALRANYLAAGVAAECVAFIADMASAYADADLVICRAGALTVSELACIGAASVLVPFPHAVDDHQTGNARFLADAGAGTLMPQNDFTVARVADLIRTTTRARCLQQAVAARALAKPDATAAVVGVIEQLVSKA